MSGDDEVPEPQGSFGGIPYDWRAPTLQRIRARWWNKADRRLLTPKAFGFGYDVNLYWLAHPGEYLRSRRHD